MHFIPVCTELGSTKFAVIQILSKDNYSGKLAKKYLTAGWENEGVRQISHIIPKSVQFVVHPVMIKT